MSGYNPYGIKRPRPSQSPTPNSTLDFSEESPDLDLDPSSPTGQYIGKLEKRLEKMEAWQQAVTPTDPVVASHVKKVMSEPKETGHVNPRAKSPLSVRTSPTNTPSSAAATPGSAFSRTPSSARAKSPGTGKSSKSPAVNGRSPANGKSPKSPSKKRMANVSKMQWGVLPSNMPAFEEFSDGLPPFTMSLDVGGGGGGDARSGMVAKKLYSQLNSLHAHYAAIKVKYDEQQPLIDGAERRVKNSNIKMKNMKAKFGGMKETIKSQQEQLESLQGMVNRLNEKAMGNMKRLMAAWRNKSLLSCWAAWKGWASGEKETKLKMKRFLMKMKLAGVSKCFTNWA
ncbi:hypothetical protein TeGR_g3062 [Tetraparma gracilis]|uniref:Uncharacterized protein n=1 Tax=Tetraparma gracilis TaxID=2962635 RepID=A0ABQ6MYY3_9STRA|nr:hypothetical protein TeGR_g3062 [Tetraparma gracilis]